MGVRRTCVIIGAGRIIEMANYTEQLSETFGYDSFRPGQEELINAVMRGRDVLGIMPTGGGKSICYQLPSIMMNGLTLVISPLISLMLDQVLALKGLGVRAAFMNSTLTPGQQHTVLSRALNGAYQIMYVAPERLSTPGFQAFCANYPIPFVAVDEAHCISQWGHNFRPDYLKIRPFIDALPRRPVIGAYTATATQKVRDDIKDSLKADQPLEVLNSFDRPNLYFEVQRPKDKYLSLKRFLRGQQGKSGIIYCSTRKTVEELCANLTRDGWNVTRYHAGLSEEERTKNQKDFLYDTCPIITATNAFGMGIDKSNVSFVVHYNMPKNIESYYQEAGRAGRDGSPASCLLLYSGQDVHTNEFLIRKSVEEDAGMTDMQKKAYLDNELELLRRMTGLAAGDSCIRSGILRYFGENPPSYCGNCGNCLAESETVDITDELRVVLSVVDEASSYRGGLGRTRIRQTLLGKEASMSGLDGFGQLAHVPAERVTQIIDWALTHNWLVSGGGQYPVLSLGTVPDSFYAGEERVTAKFPKAQHETKDTGGVKPAPEGRAAVFNRLKELRKQLALEEGVPPFMIFTDATLSDMVQQWPMSLKEFKRVKGVGSAKAAKYGTEFIAVFKSAAGLF